MKNKNKKKTPKIKIQALKNNQFLLIEDLTFDDLTVPKGFITDFASIPRLFWTLLGSPIREGRSWQAVRHDYHYRVQDVTREQADVEFRDSMTAPWHRTIYLSVRCWGWIAWNKNKKLLAKKQNSCDGYKEKRQGCDCQNHGCCGDLECCWKKRING